MQQRVPHSSPCPGCVSVPPVQSVVYDSAQSALRLLLIVLDNIPQLQVCRDLKIKSFNCLSYHTVLEFKGRTFVNMQNLYVTLHLVLLAIANNSNRIKMQGVYMTP